MSLLFRGIWPRATMALFVTAFVVWFAAPTASQSQTVQIAQLNLEFGNNKVGVSKCPDKRNPACQERNRQRNNEEQGKNKKRKLLNQGIGVILESVEQPARTKKKQNKNVTPTASKKKKAGNRPASKLADDPRDKPVFVPPEFPALARQDCEDCYILWDSIQWYELIISADARRLFDRRQEIEDRKTALEKLQSRLGGANAIDKVYYAQEIQRHTEYIDAIDKLNTELEQLIGKEWAILRQRIEQYTDCLARHCPIPEKTAQVELVPGENAPPPPAPDSTPPLEPAAPTTTYDLSTFFKIGVGFGGKDSGYTSLDASKYEPYKPALRPPDDDSKICGPDITPAVIKTLRKIREDFNKKPDKQVDACRALIDPRTGGLAWDILQLSPGVAVPPARDGEIPYKYEKEYDAWIKRDAQGSIKSSTQPWFTSTSAMCAIPRNDPVCAPTVEFFGICEHAQVVNYVQWRFMLGLCGGAYPAVGAGLHKAWNMIQYGGNAPKQAQDNMSTVAKSLLEKFEDDENATDFSDIQKALVALDAGLNKEIRQCQLTCPETIDREFNYKWTGLTEDRGVQTLRLDRDLDAMANAGLEKLESAAKAAGVTEDSFRPSNILDKILKSLGLN
jgi:hypothetical protein